MTMQRVLSEDSLAILLLCSPLGLSRQPDSRLRQFSAGEWDDLARRIVRSDLERPRALFGESAERLQSALDLDGPMSERLVRLLERSGPVAIEVESLAHRGIWVLTRADPTYPTRWRQRLAAQSPPVVFGAGAAELLERGGIAVVGSRDVDEAGAEMAGDLGRRAARAGLTVVSGAARGVDRLAMRAALDVDGRAVGVLADSLDKLARGRDLRAFIADGRLTLITPLLPTTSFHAGNLMARNKLVYCLADAAVVISSAAGEGGTWAGATENLKRGWVPLFVRNGTAAPTGNVQLINKGGIGFSSLPDPDELGEWLRQDAASHAGEQQAGHRDVDQTPLSTSNQHASVPPPDVPASTIDFFGAAWPLLVEILASGEKTVKDIVAAGAHLEQSQAKAWLNEAERAGWIKRVGRPVRYQLVPSAAIAEASQLTSTSSPVGSASSHDTAQLTLLPAAASSQESRDSWTPPEEHPTRSVSN